MSVTKKKPAKKKSKPKARSGASRSRQGGVKNFVKDIKERIHADASRILGTTGKIWPASAFGAVPSGFLSLFYISFDHFRDWVGQQHEQMWEQHRENIRAMTAADSNMAVLIRLAYDAEGEEKISELWRQLHAVKSTCAYLHGFYERATDEEKEAFLAEYRPEELEKLKASRTPPPEIPQEILDAAKDDVVVSGDYTPVEHPDEATFFGGE